MVEHRIKHKFQTVAYVEAVFDHAERELKGVDAMYHFAVFGAWIVIRPWLQDHQCFSEVMDEE